MSYVNDADQPAPPTPHAVQIPPTPPDAATSPQQIFAPAPPPMYAPAPYVTKTVYPPRRKRYWVHAVPAIVVVAVFLFPFLLARRAYQLGEAADNIDGAGYAAIFAMIFGIALGVVIGTFIILLAYLVVLPARSRGVHIAHIVFTSFFGLLAIAAALLIPILVTWILG